MTPPRKPKAEQWTFALHLESGRYVLYKGGVRQSPESICAAMNKEAAHRADDAYEEAARFVMDESPGHFDGEAPSHLEALERAAGILRIWFTIRRKARRDE